MNEKVQILRLSQDVLTATWDELATNRQMVGMIERPCDPAEKLMVSAFGTSFEQELFVQALDGDTLYDEGQAPAIAFKRFRDSTSDSWGAWQSRGLA